jgi:hypothetical protein
MEQAIQAAPPVQLERQNALPEHRIEAASTSGTKHADGPKSLN